MAGFAVPYSERFANGVSSTVGFHDVYTVPSGKRAIVSCLSVLDGTFPNVGSTYALTAPSHSDFIAVMKAPAGGDRLLSGLHLVYYAGEVISVYVAAGTPYWQIHGYLLADPP